MQACVFVDMDRVVLRIQHNDIFIPYASALSIAQHLRIAGKRAKSIIHENIYWLELANKEHEIINYSKVVQYKQFKRKFKWDITTRSEEVFFNLGGHVFKLHFIEALKLSQQIRIAAKQAKKWAGDISKSIKAAGMLTDAEENYKLGIH